MDIERLINSYHESADQFSRGNSEPIKILYSHREDVFLANPFGLTVIGWTQVSNALDFASSKFRDGVVKDFVTIANYVSSELVTIFEIEKWKAKVGGRDEIFIVRSSGYDNFSKRRWRMESDSSPCRSNSEL